MKKVLVLCVCLIGILNADWKRVMGSSDAPLPPEKEVMKSDTLSVFIRTAVFGFNEQDTTVDNKDFKRITIPEELIDWDTTNAGKPQIPYIRLLIAVPDSCDFDITVYESDYTLFEDYLLYPVPSIVFEDSAGWMGSKEVYTWDASFYQTDTLYPGKFYEVSSDGHWRDQRVLEVFLYPVQFNPGQELMYFYSGLDLRIEYSGEIVENDNGLGPFEDIGREILLNYPGIDKEPESVPEPAVHYYTKLDTNNVADYIIVTHQDFLAIAEDSLKIHEFAQWRVDHNQFDVGIVKIMDVYEEFLEPPYEDSAKALRDFLVYAYENWHTYSMSDNHFAYCLFIGDWDYVPIEMRFVGYGLPLIYMNAYEGYFRDLNSPPDSIEDIMLGRWPVKATESAGLINIAQKTINYEQYPNQNEWRRLGLLIGGPGAGYNWYVKPNVYNSEPYFADISYNPRLLLPDPTGNVYYNMSDSVHVYLDSGEIITAFYGHGGPYGWGVPPGGYGSYWYAETLHNEDRLPVVLSYACNAAMFQFDHPYYDTIVDPNQPNNYWAYDTCFAECMLWNPGGGAVAFYGGTSPIYMHTYNTIPTMRVLRNQHWILGKMLINAYKIYSHNNKNNCYCLLGDPALDLGDYTAFPDLPDLVVRPQAIDISILPPYPYPAAGDEIPIRAKVFNIGGETAYNVDVKFTIALGPDNIIYNNTITFDEIEPRDTVVVTGYWHTALTHPDFYGEIGDCDFIVTVDPNDVITESWEGNNTSSITKKVALYPHESGWPKKVTDFTQPAIANLDGVGSVEIVYVSLDSVYVFNYDGGVVQGWPQCFEDVYAVVLGDIDDNGYIDIVAVSRESIKVYDYQGNVMSDWPIRIPHSNMAFRGYPALGHVSGNQYLDVVLFATPTSIQQFDSLRVLVYRYDGSLLYDFGISTLPGKYYSNGPSISDVKAGAIDEIVISYEPTGDRSGVKTCVFDSSGLVDSLNYGSNQMISALVDLDNDGYAEVITGGSDKKIRAYKVTTGQILWERETEGAINSSPAVGDIHPAYGGPGGVEVTFGNNARRVHLREKDYGDNIPPWPDIVGGRVKTSPAIANINGDKYLDIIVGANNQYIYALNYDKTTISPFPLPLFGKPSSPVIGDIDGDRKSEIILASDDGYLHVWENMDSKVLPYLLEWPQFHHDYQRTGVYGWVGGLRGGDANPRTFSTGTTLSFTLEDNLHTKIKIYDAQGNLVKTLVNQTLPQGTYNPVWFGKDDNYVFLPNGIYFIEIKVKNESKIIPVEINR